MFALQKLCGWRDPKRLAIVFGLFLLCVLTLIAAYASDRSEERLFWEENFDEFNEVKWRHVVTGNGRCRDNRNSYVKNGVLHLRATLVSNELDRNYQEKCSSDPCLGECSLPAMLLTKEAFLVRSGRIIVRARLPCGDWLRPAIVLLSGNDSIIIAEGCGNKNLTTLDDRFCGANTIKQGLQPNGSSWDTTLPSGYFCDGFHIFSVKWNEDYISFLVDGAEKGKIEPFNFWKLLSIKLQNLNPWRNRVAMSPFDRPFHLFLGLSVSFFGNSDQNDLPPWDKPDLEVDYIRMYKS